MHGREEMEFVLKFKLEGSNDSFGYTYYENISIGGVYIVGLERRIEKDTIIELELSMPATPESISVYMTTLRLFGRITHCTENPANKANFNCGVEFIDVSPEKKNTIQRVLDVVRTKSN